MEETISTTSEVATNETTPSVDVDTTQTTEQTVEETTDVQSDETQPSESQETTEETETEQPQEKNWEKIAKDNQASFTKVSQELAELKKQMQQAKEPQIVDEKGKINPEYEQNYRFQLDNREYLIYDGLARQLEPTARGQVERLLQQANALYNPQNKSAYEQKMQQVKDYFRSDIVEQIALDRRQNEMQMKAEFDKQIAINKQSRANEVANLVEQSDDLKALLYADSESYSKPMFDIVQQVFDLAGDVDVDLMNQAVKSIKDLAVKEYLANQSVQKEKAKAVVPTANGVTQNSSAMPSADLLRQGGEAYIKAVKKYGMAKVDNIIMKG